MLNNPNILCRQFDNMDGNLELFKKSLAGKLFGKNLHFYQEVHSTNDTAFSLGMHNAAEGTAVIADSQTGGKGRLQRRWHSPPGDNLYTSVILKPEFETFRASQIPLMAGVAVARALDHYCSGITLKWPNDVMIRGKKVCGILSQAKLSANKINFIVLGIGINVNMDTHRFPEEIRNIATSLAIETGAIISRQELIISLYENLEKCYKQLLQKGFIPVRQEWLRLAPMIGRQMKIVFKNEAIEGTAVGLDDNGSLILMTAENKAITVSAGDSTIMR